MTDDTRTPARAIAPRPDLLDTSMGGVRNLEGGELRGTLAAPLRRPAAAAEGGYDLYFHANIWHARRVLANRHVVCGLGFTQQEAIDDLEANWGTKA